MLLFQIFHIIDQNKPTMFSAYEDGATPVALIFINACGLGLPMVS